MPHGQRDWSNVGAEEFVHGLSDLAELAARLGSPVLFNREGQVLFLESFEYGIQAWTTATSGASADIFTSAGWNRTSGYSCKLVAGSDADKYAQISRFFPYPYVSKYGIEFAFVFDGDLDTLDLEIYLYDGSTLYHFGVRYDHGSSTLDLYTTGNDWSTQITGVSLLVTGSPYHILKVVFDMSTGLYTRLIVNDTETNIETVPAYSVADATGAQMKVVITNRSAGGSDRTVYVDDVIVTTGEP
jgi:hypothetical protein